MLPVVLHNLTGTYCLMPECVLENNFPLNILYFLVVIRIKIIRPITIDANEAILYHFAAYLQYSFSLLLPNIDSVCPAG